MILTEDEGVNQIVLEDKVLTGNYQSVPHKIDNKSLGVKVTAESAVVLDLSTGAVLWQKNAEQSRSMASITKLMTALVFLEHNPGWQTTVTFQEIDETNGGTAHILRGETVSVKNLFYTALIASDNNSTNALVRSTGLSHEEFIKLMNQKAQELELLHTSFTGVTGLNDNNQSTALEIAQLAKIAFANEDIKSATSRKTYSFIALSGQAHKIYSTNRSLDDYLKVVAGKTGFITASGYCLVDEIRGNEEQEIIVVILGSETHEDRFQDMNILAAWVLDNFVWS